MCRFGLVFFVITIVVGMMIVEGSNITYAKRVKKGFIVKKLKKDFKRLKKQEGALKLVDGDRGIFEGILWDLKYVYLKSSNQKGPFRFLRISH